MLQCRLAMQAHRQVEHRLILKKKKKKNKQRAGVRLRLEVIGAGVTQESFPS